MGVKADGLFDKFKPTVDAGDDGGGGEAISIETGFMVMVGENCGGWLMDMSAASFCGGVGVFSGLLG